MTEPRELLQCPECGMVLWQPPGVTPECVSPWCREAGMTRTRLYVEGEDLKALRADQALANCGRCGRTLVVTLSPNWHQEFWYCADREDCARATRRPQ